ncbi:CTP synthase [Candidatus Gottesmanbacteria bacterium RIFCSPHIGHO2_01_FULL_42_12]|uniref:CTP synthase n=1 Tax=Candidatus Gottesmanbacteria bacterium RIFCSPHIGHO2_01_FULL_42_12 TaxID=1798377 RepID=A0A1F5Z5J0_9BACT|nr:MAG: CTP synthase [Candidatus Gottesmanbacteria bacterium RIFCSPHIGHO2_01_FULL_42_12]
MKYIFVSGGVISGLGKGIVTASLSLLLKNLGLKVAPIKIDMYLNFDAGTLRPQEHGETFVLADGMETDQDMGNYERFLGEDLPRLNYVTTGQIYAEVLRKERAFEYEGDTVEAIPHVTNEIINRLRNAGEKVKADVVVIELGGTVGEYQNGIFFEANRILKLKNPADVIHIHVTYLPFIQAVGELKSKPAQTSVHILNSMGIQPDFIVARSERTVDKKRADKIALFCNVVPDDLILDPDSKSVLEVPQILDDQSLSEKVCHKLNLSPKAKNVVLPDWKKMVKKSFETKNEITIGMAVKYFKSGDYCLSDSYVSVIEAIKHASAQLEIKTNIKWIDTEGLEVSGEQLEEIDGLIVPQGWGSRGVEGKIKAVQFARENNLPYLGLCFGMQMAVVEFARNVCQMKGANSIEANPKTKYPVISIMEDQKKYLEKHQYGGTIRLGQWPAVISRKTKLYELYEKESVLERHRHRYEFNNKYKKALEKCGLVVSATSPDGKLVEAIEIPNHPFFIGTQYHPELQSRPLTPHPIFLGFLEACLKYEGTDKVN